MLYCFKMTTYLTLGQCTLQALGGELITKATLILRGVNKGSGGAGGNANTTKLLLRPFMF